MPSAIEPTHPGSGPPSPRPDTSHARVIPLRKRSGHRLHTLPVEPGPPPTPQQQLAETMEAMFLARGRTLTEPRTADAYTITLEAVLLMLDGAHAEGVIDSDEAHTALQGMVEGMMGAPNEL